MYFFRLSTQATHLITVSTQSYVESQVLPGVGVTSGLVSHSDCWSSCICTEMIFFIFIFIMIFILIMIIMMMSPGCMSAPGTEDWREGSLCSSSFLLSLTYYTSYNTQIFIIGLLLLSLGWTTWGVYWMVRALYRCRQKFYENLNHCDFETVYWIHYHYHGARRNSQKKSFASFFLFLCEHFRKAFVIFLKQL